MAKWIAEEQLNNGKHAFTNLTINVSYANSEHSSMLQIVIICAITGDVDNICSGRVRHGPPPECEWAILG